ncbi:hypothetical protein [Amantichitinum ursilacus]|uniref:Uncharacterized protein n=1 Tax=Amantichitinum ursilacus TaxID=857265 RepID=A0A0N0GQF3_9NEIS|nr:hypothetical protein [Amantichitinum ursilacus]KPC54633.1 hypothetical protein WG78_03640 [Amantichitinum ursilacus]
MNKVVIAVALCVAGGAYAYVSSKKVSEDGIKEFYKNDFDYTVQMKADALCNEYADNFEGVSVSEQFGQKISKAETCDTQKKTFEAIKKQQDSANGGGAIAYKVDIKTITLDRDERTATVELAYTFNMNPVIKSSGTRKDVIQKVDGQYQIVQSTDAGQTVYGSQ